MACEYYLSDNFIITDILKEINNKSEFYSCDTLKGLNALKALGVKLSTSRVKSYPGTFIQAKLAGICLASGWAKKYAKGIMTDSLLPELFKIEFSMNWRDFNVNISNKTHEEAIIFSLMRGFENGIRLGRMAKEQLKGQPITTEYLVHFLKQHTEQQNKNTPTPVLKHTQCGHRQLKTRGYEHFD